MSLTRLFALLAALLALGCATTEESLEWSAGEDNAQVGGPDDFDLTEKIINGRLSYDFPAAGMLRTGTGLCTATLVRPNVVLTAAHCIDYQTVDRPGQQLAQFIVQHSDAQQFAFPIEAFVSYSPTGPGTDDIALLRLSTAVPANVATPVPFAERKPNAGEQVTWYGYGCQNRGGSDQFTGRKQKLAFAYQQSDNSCPGDSGGPTVFGADGAVFRVTSGYYVAGGDIFGDVVAMRGTLEAQANAWGGALDNDNGVDDGGADNGGADNVPPPAAPPAADRPQILRTVIHNGWIFVEWARVATASQYVQFLIVELPNGDIGPYLYRTSAGEAASANSLYGYFNADTVCRTIRSRGLPPGSYALWTQIWPDRDNGRAESAKVSERLTCR